MPSSTRSSTSIRTSSSGPANHVLGGGAMLVGTLSQYGVASIDFIAGWFAIVGVSNGTLGLIDGILQAFVFAGGYLVVRAAGVGRVAAIAGFTVAVVVLVLALVFPLGGSSSTARSASGCRCSSSSRRRSSSAGSASRRRRGSPRPSPSGSRRSGLSRRSATRSSPSLRSSSRVPRLRPAGERRATRCGRRGRRWRPASRAHLAVRGRDPRHGREPAGVEPLPGDALRVPRRRHRRSHLRLLAVVAGRGRRRDVPGLGDRSGPGDRSPSRPRGSGADGGGAAGGNDRLRRRTVQLPRQPLGRPHRSLRQPAGGDAGADLARPAVPGPAGGRPSRPHDGDRRHARSVGSAGLGRVVLGRSSLLPVRPRPRHPRRHVARPRRSSAFATCRRSAPPLPRRSGCSIATGRTRTRRW